MCEIVVGLFVGGKVGKGGREGGKRKKGKREGREWEEERKRKRGKGVEERKERRRKGRRRKGRRKKGGKGEETRKRVNEEGGRRGCIDYLLDQWFCEVEGDRVSMKHSKGHHHAHPLQQFHMVLQYSS